MHLNLLKLHVLTEHDLSFLLTDDDFDGIDSIDINKTDFDWDYAQLALVDVDKNEVIYWNDNIHDNISDRIDTFLDAITVVGNTYTLDEDCIEEKDMKKYKGGNIR